MSNAPSITRTRMFPITDRFLDVPEGDYPEVAQEVIQYVRTKIDRFQDELAEFLEQRETAAPTMVDRARVLDSILAHETRRWLQRCTR